MESLAPSFAQMPSPPFAYPFAVRISSDLGGIEFVGGVLIEKILDAVDVGHQRGEVWIWHERWLTGAAISEFDQLVAIDRIGNGPAHFRIVPWRCFAVEAKTRRPPVGVAIRLLLATMGDDLGILREERWHRCWRDVQGDVGLVGDHHLRHSRLFEWGQEDQALHLRKRGDARCSCPPIWTEIPDLLLGRRLNELIRAGHDGKPIGQIVIRELGRNLRFPDVCRQNHEIRYRHTASGS